MKKILLTLLLVLSLVTSAYAMSIPHAFYGTASFSDGPITDGTVITAKLNGNSVDTAIVKNGKYGYGSPDTPDTLVVTDDEGQGGIITFHIGDIAADQEIVFQSEEVTKLDLIFSGTTPPGTVPTGNTTSNTSTTTNTTNTTQTENSPGDGGSSGNSGSGSDSGGSSSGGGGGGGGSSGSSSSSSDDKDDEDNQPSALQPDNLGDDDNDETASEDSQTVALQGAAENSGEGAPQGLANLLTGAFTGVFSKTSGKLAFIAAVFILTLLGLTFFRHFKKKK